MSRHLPTFTCRLSTQYGPVHVITSPWRATDRPLALTIGPVLNTFTIAEARAMATAITEAANHLESVHAAAQDKAA